MRLRIGRAQSPRSPLVLRGRLRNEFERFQPTIGERLGVKRLPDSAKGYKMFLVRVDRTAVESQPDWSLLGTANTVAQPSPTDGDGNRGDDDDVPF